MKACDIPSVLRYRSRSPPEFFFSTVARVYERAVLGKSVNRLDQVMNPYSLSSQHLKLSPA